MKEIMLNDHIKACIIAGFFTLICTVYIHISGGKDEDSISENIQGQGKLRTSLSTSEQTHSVTYLMGEGRNEFLQTHSDHLMQSIQPSFSSSQVDETSVDNSDNKKVKISYSHKKTEERDFVKTKFVIDSTQDIHSTSESVNYQNYLTSSIKVSQVVENIYDPFKTTEQNGVTSDVLTTKSTLVTVYNAAESDSLNVTCYADVLQNMKPICHPKCLLNSRTFSLPGMMECHSWLTCADIDSEVEKIKQIGEGTVKKVFVGRWRNYSVAINTLKDGTYRDDFLHGIQMLMALTGHRQIVQLIGVCQEKNIFITEYHPLGNINTFIRHLREHPELQSFNSISNRMRFCLDYINIITFLHESPIGVRIMCDSSQLGKLLHQILVTNGLSLVLHDLDALPEVNDSNNNKIVCGHMELKGDFVAPEQRWPFKDHSFKTEDQPPYNEKVDIWKVPDVCDYFLGNDSSADLIKYKLFETHKKCKSVNPLNRPNAREILNIYQLVYTNVLQESPKI